MLRVTVNGVAHEAPPGSTILNALRRAGVRVPTLCHDERLEPYGGCRLCAVHVAGAPRPVAACTSALADGMAIETHTPALEADRRTLLELLARSYPRDAVERAPEKDLHRWLASYGVEARGASDEAQEDGSHPFIHVDMSQCISCFRCVRICDELQGQFVWEVWGRGDRTRIRPDSGTTLLESSCVSCGACVSACPTGALEDRSVLASGAPTAWTRTTCAYCGVGCELLAGTRDDRIVAARPVLEAPVSKGHLCVKGRYSFGFVDAKDRATTPMIREGSAWRRVSWEEAISFVASGLSRILASRGPSGVGVLGSARATNEEGYVAQKFARVVLGTNNVDCCARVCHAPSAAAMAAMLGTGAATSSFDDIELARTILLAGSNATECHPIVGARIKQRALAGAKLIVIDPRRTELAEVATVHLALRPGTNIPLLNALAHVILEEGLADRSFLERRVSGLEAFRASVEPWTPERAATITGVDPALIRTAARIYATEKPAIELHGLGLTEHTQGTASVMGVVNLALLTGNMGKPGAGVNPLRGQNNVQGAAHMGCEPGRLTGYVPLEEGRALVESVWGAPVPREPGRNLMQMIDGARDGTLGALWSIGYDVLFTNPDTNATRAALRNLELVIVQDLFENEIAREVGTVFLPAASSFEKDGTFMNAERRIQRVRRAIAPRGESRSDWEILCAVASAMGHGAAFSFRSAEEIWEEIRKVWKAGAGITYGRLESEGGLQWPCPALDHPGTRILHGESFPIGERAALRPLEFTPTRERTTSEHPLLLSTGRSLFQFNAGTMTGRTGCSTLRPTDLLEISPEDALRLGLAEGDLARVESGHGEATLPGHVTGAVKPGELYATFHDPRVFLNHVTGPERDGVTCTPEYKVTAVEVEPAPTRSPGTSRPGAAC